MYKKIIAVSLVALLSGCAAADVAMNHSDLKAQTHMSETIFLDPVPPSAKTIYVSARNTSDHPELDIRGPLTQYVAARGYTIVQDPNQAHYMLRINILQAGQIDPNSKNSMLMAKYGEPLLGGVAAGAIANSLGAGNGTSLGVGLGVGAATFLANQMIKDVTFSVVVDVQLSERPLNGAKVSQSTNTYTGKTNMTNESAKLPLTPGGSGYSSSSTLNTNGKSQRVDEQSDFKQYQLRQIAYADKMNLKFEEATPLLITKISMSLANLFE
jgi:opacity protein-like surface antigen